MLAKFNETRNILMPYCTPNPGNFGLESETNRISLWDTCREQFAAKFNDKVDGFYFSHAENKGYDIANFLFKFEMVVKTSHDQYDFDFSEYSLTSSNHVLYVRISPFWRECFFRRSFLTTLMRCGQNFDQMSQNFDEALFSQRYKETCYLNETRNATMRFMCGFTRYTGAPPIIAGTVIKHGWREEFSNLDMKEVRRKLVLPAGFSEIGNLVGQDSCWC